MTSFVQLIRRLLDEGQPPDQMIALAEQYLHSLNTSGSQTGGAGPVVEELEAFVASARSGKAAAPALQAENDALRRRVEELEARQAKLYPLVGDLFRTACEVANCAQTANRNKGGSHSDEISEVWTGAVEAMGAAIDALSVADEEFSKFLENHTEEQ